MKINNKYIMKKNEPTYFGKLARPKELLMNYAKIQGNPYYLKLNSFTQVSIAMGNIEMGATRLPFGAYELYIKTADKHCRECALAKEYFQTLNINLNIIQ